MAKRKQKPIVVGDLTPYQELRPSHLEIMYWLLLLKPGQWIELYADNFGVKAETIQNYIYAINEAGPRKYQVVGGANKDVVTGLLVERDQTKPVLVRYVGTREESEWRANQKWANQSRAKPVKRPDGVLKLLRQRVSSHQPR